MNKKKERHQITFDIAPDIHKQIKVYAALRNITMNRWMQKAINEKLQKETQYDKENPNATHDDSCDGHNI